MGGRLRTGTEHDVEKEAVSPSNKAALRHRALQQRKALGTQDRARKSQLICEQLSRGLASGQTVGVYAALRYEVDLDMFVRHAYGRACRVAFPALLAHERAGQTMCMRAVSNEDYGQSRKANAQRANSSGSSGSPARVVEARQAAASNQHASALFSNPCSCERSACPKAIPPQGASAADSGRNAPHGAPFVENPLAIFDPEPETAADLRFPVIPPADFDLLVVPLVAFDEAGTRLGYGGGNYDRYLPLLSTRRRIIGVAFEEQRLEFIPRESHDLPIERIISA